MRIIAGSAKRIKLRVPSGRAVRPTAARVKEALFNILASRVPGSMFLDLFSGSGSIGIEALSRGALKATFIEKERHYARLISGNLKLSGLEGKARVLNQDVLKALSFLRGECFDFIFMDPPYYGGFEYGALDAIAHYNLLKAGGVAVVESGKHTVLPVEVAGLRLFRQERYGDTLLSFYQMETGEAI